MAPEVVVLAGPNGAGKSTAAPGLLAGLLDLRQFINADVIAQGLAAYDPSRVAVSAGRIMLARLDELAAQRASFAFETTLAGRTYAPWLRKLRQSGYRVDLLYLWLPTVDVAISRVAQRAVTGGHSIPEPTIRRRYALGLRNFFHLYLPLATHWRLYDAMVAGGPALAAEGSGDLSDLRVHDTEVWERSQHDAAR